jgi:lysozyme family protein
MSEGKKQELGNFEDAWKELLGHEGGYVNHPSDPGGETNYGITKRVAVANGYTEPMKYLPEEKAKAIAKKVYWTPYKCDQLPYKIAELLLDITYNGGYGVKWVQRAVGVTVDGVIGPKTIQAALAADPSKVVMLMVGQRIVYLTNLSTWATFGKGWARRSAATLERGAKG